MGTSSINGFGSLTKEYEQKPLSLDDLLVDRPSSTFCAILDTDDLLPHGIFKGDLLIVDQSLIVADKDLIICSLLGDIFCSQIFVTGAKINLKTATKVFHVDNETDFLVLGVISRSVRCFKKLPDFG